MRQRHAEGNMVSSLMRSLFFVLAALLLNAVLADAVFAVTVDGSSRSYLQKRDSLSGDTLLPGYEYLDLAVRDLGNDEFSLHFGGWGRFDFKQETGETDLQYAYLSYARKKDNIVVNLGRVLVFEGVAAERVDGVYARADLAGNFSLSAFGGMAAEESLDAAGNNLIYGARLGHQAPGLYRIGISALEEEKNDNRFRQEAGIDLWVHPYEKAELLGRSAYDSVADDWMEHAYTLVLGPFGKIRLYTEGSHFVYSAYFRTAGTEAFNFSQTLLDRDEEATTIGEEISYAATDKVTVLANYRFYDYKKAGNASSYGGRINYSRGRDGAAGFSVNRVDGDDDRLRYTQVRLYGARVIGRTDVAVDLIDTMFDESISGTDDAYSATLAFAYNLTDSLRAGADVEWVTSPVVDRDLRILAKIIYRFGFKIGGGA